MEIRHRGKRLIRGIEPCERIDQRGIDIGMGVPIFGEVRGDFSGIFGPAETVELVTQSEKALRLLPFDQGGEGGTTFLAGAENDMAEIKKVNARLKASFGTLFRSFSQYAQFAMCLPEKDEDLGGLGVIETGQDAGIIVPCRHGDIVPRFRKDGGPPDMV